MELLRKAGQVNRKVGDYTILNRTPKEMALREEEDIKKHKEALWQKVCISRQYLQSSHLITVFLLPFLFLLLSHSP